MASPGSPGGTSPTPHMGAPRARPPPPELAANTAAFPAAPAIPPFRELRRNRPTPGPRSIRAVDSYGETDTKTCEAGNPSTDPRKRRTVAGSNARGVSGPLSRPTTNRVWGPTTLNGSRSKSQEPPGNGNAGTLNGRPAVQACSHTSWSRFTETTGEITDPSGAINPVDWAAPAEGRSSTERAHTAIARPESHFMPFLSSVAPGSILQKRCLPTRIEVPLGGGSRIPTPASACAHPLSGPSTHRFSHICLFSNTQRYYSALIRVCWGAFCATSEREEGVVRENHLPLDEHIRPSRGPPRPASAPHQAARSRRPGLWGFAPRSPIAL